MTVRSEQIICMHMNGWSIFCVAFVWAIFGSRDGVFGRTAGLRPAHVHHPRSGSADFLVTEGATVKPRVPAGTNSAVAHATCLPDDVMLFCFVSDG